MPWPQVADLYAQLMLGYAPLKFTQTVSNTNGPRASGAETATQTDWTVPWVACHQGTVLLICDMRFRYRRLTAHRDQAAISDLQTHLAGDDLDAMLCAEVDAPRKVIAAESEGNLDEIEELLRAGELSPSDLVLSGGLWTTFSNAPEFFELCSELEKSQPFSSHRNGRFSTIIEVCRRAALFLVRVVVGDR